MSVTIKDIARETGVSMKTVSRVINNSPEVAPKTREQVLSIIKKMNYQPNAHARSLILNKTETIGLFVAYETRYVFTNPYFSQVFRGINEICNQVGYNILFQAKEESSFINEVRSGKIDGLLYMCVKQDVDFTEELLLKHFPFVLIGKDPVDERLPWVEVDDEYGGYIAGRHLLEQGHRKIGFIGGSYSYMSNIKRFKGFCRALAEYKLEVRRDWVVHNTHNSQEEGYQGMLTLLTALEKPSAVFVFSDLLAIGALQALRDKGINVPDEMAIMGFDNIMPSQYTDPPLTTVEQPAFEKGALATRMLLNLINKVPLESKHVLLKPRLIVRDSCGPSKVDE